LLIFLVDNQFSILDFISKFSRECGIEFNKYLQYGLDNRFNNNLARVKNYNWKQL